MKYFLCIVFFASISSLLAQNSATSRSASDRFTCGQYPMTEAFFDAHPEERAAAMVARAGFNQFAKEFSKSLQKDDDVLIIPVVFHVIHFNGEENISEAQVHSAIEVLNEDYSASNSGIGIVVSDFQDRIANVGFEFRLAKIDPDGNCTNGIERVMDYATFDGGDELKQISPIWDRSSYLNVWVCKSIGGGVAGYAYLPSGVNGSNGAQVDGIVIQDDYVGRIGTGSPNLSHSLSHEVGHWASLLHPWGPTNNPGVSSNCNVDDGIADTPNTEGWTTCDLQGNTCGSLDNVQNFMDYSYCDQMFTSGQKNQMRAALNSSISQRNQLWSQANLEDTGVLEDDIVCQANFQTTGEQVICAGQTVTFEDLSFNSPSNWSWTFEGGNPATSSQENPEVTFAEPGSYDVSLIASNDGGSASITKSGYIKVMALGENVLPFTEGFESFSSLENNSDNWIVVNPDESNIKWKLTSNAAYSGSKSVYVRGRQNSNGAVEYLQSPTYDLSGLSENAVLQFKYAHAKRNFNSEDELRVDISRNCGENWSFRLNLDNDDLPTVSNSTSSEFTPESIDDWAEVEINNISSVFFNDQFRFRFGFTSFQGNNIYIDDINLFDPSSVGLEEVKFVNYIELYPNPAQNRFTLKYGMEKSGDVTVSVVDMTGRIVAKPISGHKAAGEQMETINVQRLSPGVYFVQLRSAGELAVRKLVVQ